MMKLRDLECGVAWTTLSLLAFAGALAIAVLIAEVTR
jgi:hypothetical protein